MVEFREQQLEDKEDKPMETTIHDEFQNTQVDDTYFELPFEEIGLPGGYHTANDPADRFHRPTVTYRPGFVDIRGTSKVIIHGSLSPKSEEAATLLVYEFTFNPTGRFRRIASATIQFEFSYCEPKMPGLEVYSIAPSSDAGRWSLAETIGKEHTENSTNTNLSLGYQGLSAGGVRTWAKSVDRDIKDSTTITGDTTCDAYGKETGAKFVLLENGSARPKTGIPSFFRLAILLKREVEDEEFQCTVNIEVKADWKTRMTNFFAAKTYDDPIYFNPSLAPVNKIREFDGKFNIRDLASTNLDELFDATMYTTFNNAVKRQR